MKNRAHEKTASSTKSKQNWRNFSVVRVQALVNPGNQSQNQGDSFARSSGSGLDTVCQAGMLCPPGLRPPDDSRVQSAVCPAGRGRRRSAAVERPPPEGFRPVSWSADRLCPSVALSDRGAHVAGPPCGVALQIGNMTGVQRSCVAPHELSIEEEEPFQLRSSICLGGGSCFAHIQTKSAKKTKTIQQ